VKRFDPSIHYFCGAGAAWTERFSEDVLAAAYRAIASCRVLNPSACGRAFGPKAVHASIEQMFQQNETFFDAASLMRQER
jgi:hypothetical protein